jgi:hypothetical protein
VLNYVRVPGACKYYSQCFCFRFGIEGPITRCKECPKNTEKSWPQIEDVMREKAELNAREMKRQRTIKDYFHALIPVLQAKTTGKSISLPQIQKRMEICSECEKITVIENEVSCGVCTCHLTVKNGTIPDIIALEETTAYGCKHPEGSQWKRSHA